MAMRVSLALLLVLVSGLAPADSEAGVWVSPEGASRAGFLLDTFWHGVEGTTSVVSATLKSSSGDPLTDGRIEVAIDAATLNTGNKRRDRKMKANHLETVQYPSIRFISRSDPRRALVSADSVFMEVRGDLTLHGVTRSVDATVEALKQVDGWLMKSHFVIRLSDYQIANPGTFFNKVRDELDIYFEILLVPAENNPAGEQP